jgi:hypothetical protein
MVELLSELCIVFKKYLKKHDDSGKKYTEDDWYVFWREYFRTNDNWWEGAFSESDLTMDNINELLQTEKTYVHMTPDGPDSVKELLRRFGWMTVWHNVYFRKTFDWNFRETFEWKQESGVVYEPSI